MVDSCVAINYLFSAYSKRIKAAKRHRFWNLQFSTLKGFKSVGHQINTTGLNHLRFGSIIFLGIGQQGKFQWFIYFPLSFLRTFLMKERESSETEELHLVGVSLEPVGPMECHWGNRFSMFCTCYFVAFMTCFLIELMSLNLDLRDVSYFQLVSFYTSSSSQFLQPPGWVILTQIIELLYFEMLSYHNVPKSAQVKGDLQRKANTRPI